MKLPKSIAVGFYPKITQPGSALSKDFPAIEICSVSNHISSAPDDWVEHWLHNELGFYDSEWAAMQIVRDDPAQYDLYAYKLAPLRCLGADQERFDVPRTADPVPSDYEFLGYDIVTKSVTSFFECSPLSCNWAADDRFSANQYCLIDNPAEAYKVLTAISIDGNFEAGPYYLFEVYRKRRPFERELPSLVPAGTERIVETAHQDERVLRSVRYEVGGTSVARRIYDERGGLELEYALRDDKAHGPWRRYYPDGQLLQVGHYVEGKEHGVARQYDESGALIGSHEMVHGTGLDLWYSAAGVLAEERSYLDGERHGFERWWNEDNRTIYEESHFWRGSAHGIMRQWTAQGRLRRGYPQYFVQGERVTKKQYLRACQTDPTLPIRRAQDDQPERPLPASVMSQLAATD